MKSNNSWHLWRSIKGSSCVQLQLQYRGNERARRITFEGPQVLLSSVMELDNIEDVLDVGLIK